MKNYEKYAEEIKKFEGDGFCDDFIIPHIIKSQEHCNCIRCDTCHMLQMIWLMEEYEELEVDWSKVDVDTPILVGNSSEDDDWFKRHFAKYENDNIYAWSNGCTSWTSYNDNDMSPWKYAKLAKGEE